MQPDDREIKDFLSQWSAEEPSPFLATRIIANATALPQKQPWHRAFGTFFTHSFTEWNYALAYKGAALALCLMLGILTAHELPQTTPNVARGNAIGDMWTEEL